MFKKQIIQKRDDIHVEYYYPLFLLPQFIVFLTFQAQSIHRDGFWVIVQRNFYLKRGSTDAYVGTGCVLRGNNTWRNESLRTIFCCLLWYIQMWNNLPYLSGKTHRLFHFSPSRNRIRSDMTLRAHYTRFWHSWRPRPTADSSVSHISESTMLKTPDSNEDNPINKILDLGNNYAKHFFFSGAP